MYEVLKRYFGYDGFRNGQEDLIGAILSGRDVLGIMPTGAGIPVSGSAGGSITGSTTTTTEYQETTYEKDVCGSGSGLCVDAAPSGHPCEG